MSRQIQPKQPSYTVKLKGKVLNTPPNQSRFSEDNMLRGKMKRVTPTLDPGILCEFHTEEEAQAFYQEGLQSRGAFEKRGTHAVLLRLHPEPKST